MKKQMGILIMKDENDILEEYLTKVTQFYDKILVLDGSDDLEGKYICSKFSEVIFYERDENVVQFANDSTTRGFLWEKAKSIVDDKDWVGILHPDEFPSGNVLDMLSNIPSNFNVVTIFNRHYFLHTSQKDTWNFKPGDKIENKLMWYMGPGCIEHRYFRFNKDFYYSEHHGIVIPHNAGQNFFIREGFYHKQYTYRSKEQAIKRANSRFDSGWQKDEYCPVLSTGDVFFDTLKFKEETARQFPEQYTKCWYNWDGYYVGKD